MQLYAVNFIPLLGSLYKFRVFYTPIIRSTIFNCMNVGPCHHGIARPQVADGGTASNMEGSCE